MERPDRRPVVLGMLPEANSYAASQFSRESCSILLLFLGGNADIFKSQMMQPSEGAPIDPYTLNLQK